MMVLDCRFLYCSNVYSVSL